MAPRTTVRCSGGRFASTVKKQVEDNLKPYEKKEKKDISWKSGRRVVEIGCLAEKLNCKKCKAKLHLSSIIRETRYGLGSLFHVKCTACSHIRRVPSGKRHLAGKIGPARCFDVNSKLASGKLNFKHIDSIAKDLFIFTYNVYIERRQDELCEGKTYECGLEATRTTPAEDLQTIPEPPRSSARIQIESIRREDVIVFDLETTGLGVNSHIIQIAALHRQTGDMFSCYVQPRSGFIPSAVTKVTGLEFHGNVMFYYSQPVPSMQVHRALSEFKDWLDKYNKQQVLVAHNANFDAKIIVQSFKDAKITFPATVCFADTLKLFKAEFPNLPNYKQETLVSVLLKASYTAHNAAQDVSTLSDLLDLVADFEHKLNIFSGADITDKLVKLCNEKLYISSYSELIEMKITSKANAKRLAGMGLTVSDLKVAFDRNGTDGLQCLMRESVKRSVELGKALATYFENEK